MRHRDLPHAKADEAVSPIIAVILMVAIAVVLAATVYVWVSGYDTGEREMPEASIAAKGLDATSAGAEDWIRLTITRAESAPYDFSVVDLTLIAPNGEQFDASTHLCLDPVGDASGCVNLAPGSGETWDHGETAFVPCQDRGTHTLLVTVRNTVVLDPTVRCDAGA